MAVDLCPWHVSAHAVDRYLAIRGVRAARDSLAWDDASDDLIEYAAATWARYQADPARAPQITKTGAYLYSGPGPWRLRLVVSMDQRQEGKIGQVVDVQQRSPHSRPGEPEPTSDRGPAYERRQALRRQRRG